MKEASGEANMTVITIVIIGVVLALGLPIVKNLLDEVDTNSTSTSHGCGTDEIWNGTACVNKSEID